MSTKSMAPIPEPIAELQRQLKEFRSGHRPRTRLPESVWQAAVELARQHGVYAVADPLRLDYMKLKQRLEGVPIVGRKTAQTAFVELLAPRPAPPEEYAIEFEAASGSRMRLRWKAAGAPDWAGLLRAWREAER